MAKICGFLGTHHDQAEIARIVRDMASAMTHDSLDQIAYQGAGRAGMATLVRPGHATSDSLHTEESGQMLALAGYALDTASVRHNATAGDMTAGALLRAYRWDGDGLLARLNGDFAFAAFDPRRGGMLTLGGSTFGFCPLFYHADARGCWFASEAKALLAVLPGAALDWEAAGDFFYIGHMLGTRTLFQGIAALDAGQVLIYSGGHAEQHRYADFTHAPPMPAEDVSTKELATRFLSAVERRLAHEGENTLLLSGGLDSRLILGALHRLGARPRLVSLEHANIRQGADGRYAAEIARHLGLECEVRATRPGFYASPEALEVFYILDGMAPTWELFIGQIYPELEPSFGTVWDGLALDVGLGGSHQRSEAPQANMIEFLEKRARNRRLLRQILTPEAFQALDASFAERLRGEIEQVPDSENRYVHFLLKNRTRRRIAPNPYQLYASRAAARTPGTDVDFLRYSMAIPSGSKLDHALYLAMVGEHFPELLAVPLVSGGSPVHVARSSGTALQDSIERMRLGLIRASRELGVNKRVKQLMGQPLTARDQALGRLIVRVLGETGFNRPCFNTAPLERWFEQYRRGNIHYHELFALVFYIELWHRLFLEGDAAMLFDLAETARAATPHVTRDEVRL